MISVKDLFYAYPRGKGDVLHGISFHIDRGMIYGFLGPNGSGKSTTQKIMMNILSGFRGTVEIDGVSVGETTRRYFEKIGVVFEFPNLYEKFTAAENLNYFGAFYRKCPYTVGEVLDRVGLGDDAHTRVGNYSKGMRMRLNIARAIRHDPDILYLDEPTSGLDPVNAGVIMDLILEKKAEGKTIFLTTHDMHVAASLCDEVAFLVDGAIAVSGPPRDLMIRYGEACLDLEYRRNGRTDSAVFPLEGLGGNGEFLKIIGTFAIERIHSREASLDEVFRKVTGRSLV